MKLYQKLKEKNLVEDYKDFHELIYLRSIKVDGKIIDNPKHDLKEDDKNIKVGILSIEY